MQIEDNNKTEYSGNFERERGTGAEQQVGGEQGGTAQAAWWSGTTKQPACARGERRAIAPPQPLADSTATATPHTPLSAATLQAAGRQAVNPQQAGTQQCTQQAVNAAAGRQAGSERSSQAGRQWQQQAGGHLSAPWAGRRSRQPEETPAPSSVGRRHRPRSLPWPQHPAPSPPPKGGGNKQWGNECV